VSSAQDRTVIGALLLAESAWLFAVFSLFGLGLGLGGSPLAWLSGLFILAASFFTTRGLQYVIMPALLANVSAMVAGVVVLYLTLGFQISSGPGLDILWITNLGLESEGSQLPLIAATAGIFGVVLWWRGGNLAGQDYIVDALGTTFTLGLLALGFAAIIDIFSVEDLNVFWLMFLFFGSCLGGLAAGHLLPASQLATEKTWARTIGGVISAVLIVGLFFSLLHESVLNLLSSVAMAVLNATQTVIFYVLILPIGLVAGLLIEFLLRLWNWLIGDPGPREGDNAAAGGDGPAPFDIEELGEAGEPGIIVDIIEWTLLVIFVLILLFVLSMAFRRRSRRRLVLQESERESVMGEADPTLDMARLLSGLLPSWLSSRKRPDFKLPDDDADLVDVFRIYFGLLVIADDRGFPRPPNETPMEYQSTLERLVPRSLARMATAAFIKACYGHQPTPRDQIEQMRTSLDQLSSEA
jgi:hypothetical protein